MLLVNTHKINLYYAPKEWPVKVTVVVLPLAIAVLTAARISVAALHH